MKVLFPALSSMLLVSSCSFYDYPHRQIVAREGGEVLRFHLGSVEKDAVKLSGGTGTPVLLKTGGRLSAGNNNHLILESTNTASKEAVFRHSWLEWHGGLTLPPF